MSGRIVKACDSYMCDSCMKLRHHHPPSLLPKIIPGECGIMYVVRGGSELLAIPMRKLSAR